MPEKYVRREGLPLLVRHTGRTTLPEAPPLRSKGASVVCLHDAGLQSSVFESVLDALDADGASAIAFDLPGHGRSGGLDALPSIEAMAEMARWVAGWCAIEKALLVGHGMGSLVALEWARSSPDSVAGVVLCGVGAAMGIEDEAIDLMRKVSRGKAPRPFDPSRVCKASGREMMQRAYMEGIKTDPRATLGDLEATRAWADAFEANGDTLRCPVRVIRGSAESAEDRRRAEQLAASLGDAEIIDIDEAAHFLPLEKPTALAAEIQRLRREAAEAS